MDTEVRVHTTFNCMLRNKKKKKKKRGMAKRDEAVGRENCQKKLL